MGHGVKHLGYEVVVWPLDTDVFTYGGVDFDCRNDTVYFVEPHGPFVMSPTAFEELKEQTAADDRPR